MAEATERGREGEPLVTVRLFGPQALRAGTRELRVPLPRERVTCAELREALEELAPSLGSTLPGSRIAVNQRFAGEGDELGPDDEVALIGMIAGG